ncbi:Alpha-latrocrustotoxin [Dactylellina cionopaga]|nr:Alpha-latrocrustotoxin [Dactylellina cionopaga]
MRELASGLDTAYEKTMERIQNQEGRSKELAEQAIAWIIHAKQALTKQELLHALAVRPYDSKLDEDGLPSVETLLSVCAGLVKLDRERETLDLVHATTREYFERKKAVWFPDADRDITRACVTYLSFEAFNTGICPTEKQLHPLYFYAARYWGYHAQSSSSKMGTELARLILAFLQNDTNMSASNKAMSNMPQNMKGVHFAAIFNLEGIMTGLISNGADLELKDSYNRTPLFWATVYKYDAMMSILVDGGATLDTKIDNGLTPLLWAVMSNSEGDYEGVVKFLAEKGANLEAEDIDFDRTSLSWAAKNGDKVLVEFLIDKGANIEAKDRYGRTPLSWAAETGYEAILGFLVEKGADLEVEDLYFRRTPLLWAIKSGHEAVVKLLVSKSASLSSMDRYRQTPLALARRNRSRKVEKILVDAGSQY